MFTVHGARPEVAAFVLQKFGAYSGLDFRHVRPEDDLVDDLKFPLVT